MADQILNTIVTEYMKGLTEAQVLAIISDIEDLFDNYYTPGWQALVTAVNSDSSTEWKNAFKQPLHASNSQFFELSSEININAGLQEGIPYLALKPSARPSTQTRDKIKSIYSIYFKPIVEAGKGITRTDPRSRSSTGGLKNTTGPQYPVMSPGILAFGKEVYPQFAAPPPRRKNYYQNLQTLDAYSALAQTDYLFRYLFDNESTLEPQVETYISNYRKRFSDIDGVVDPGNMMAEISDMGIIINRLYYSTIAGFLAALRAIKEKLQNYNTVEKNYKSTPETSVTENANTTFLEDQLNTILNKWDIRFNLDAYIKLKLPERVFNDPSKIESIKKGFYNLFIPSGAASLPVNEKYGKNIWEKIRTSGLLDLAVSAGSIAEFAQKRFSVGSDLLDPVKGSAANALDPVRDTMWLNDLSRAMTTLTRDPITLSIIQNYFPNLVTLFFNATAAAADYSGGSSDDPINNVEALAKSLIESFGLDKDGKPIFEAAWDFINTGQRIQEALKQFPFRENIPPKTPDLFHLRLGASNFYVPPVAISINSQFKTGSLTGGAIRQKNSPKFNAGYKETTIGLKLFFPNYEEIWGISIDGIRDFTIDKDFKIDFKEAGNEEQIDKFLSSLRGLVAAFKYAPILPIKNVYLNSVHGITGVALSSMSISTIPNYPFALVVDLELFSFNHKPFLPMIKDFNQAVHWGKFRHYMGKAAGSLHSYINESFFLGKTDSQTPTDLPGDRADELIQMREKAGEDYGNIVEPDLLKDPFKNDIFNTNVIKEWRNGNNISLYIPERVQTKIFTPDTSSFRGDEEKLLEDSGQSFWDAALKSLGIDINQSASYGRSLDSVVQTSIEGSISPSARRIVLESIDIILAGKNRKEFNEKAYDFYAKAFIAENKSLFNQEQQNEINYILAKPGSLPPGDYTSTAVTYYYKNKPLQKNNGDNYSLKDVRSLFEKSSEGVEAFLDNLALQDAAEKAATTGKKQEDFLEQSKDDIGRAFNVLFYNRYFKSGPIQKLMEAQRLKSANYQFNEWEVPMVRVDLDPKAVIVNGVSVTLGNNLAKLQLQMQDEPTYQHIGGKDTYMNISMTVFGEKELIKLRKVFEHINGLARLEHATGVIGFMGIKNIIAGLAGMKYVMPLTYQVDTIPNYPHVYDVRVSFVDFDIFQQQREKLSSKQQADMVKVFGTKKNPFLRIKQLWGAFNAYPDFPLMVKNSDGETVGTLDPDYYFRSFEMFDDDVIYHLQAEEKKLDNFTIAPKTLDSNSSTTNQKRNNKILNDIKELVINNDKAGLKNYFNEQQISLIEAAAYVEGAVREFLKGKKSNLLSDFIEEYPEADGQSVKLSVERTIGSESIKYNTKVGQIAYSADNAIGEIQKLLSAQQTSTSNEEFVSINTEELEIHHTIILIPAAENPSDDKLPAILYHANGYHLGYVGKYDNRFYFTSDGVQLTKSKSGDPNDGKIEYRPVAIPFGDADSPAKAYAARDASGKEMGAAHITALGGTGANLARTHDPYTKSDPNTPEVTASSATEGSVAKHWERMLIDTKYRDISGRMIRAFPTYMLWLIDEGGYVSGVKMFDNFYGLQSVIDFSIVQSEDILGDTLILRVSNMYSKLTTPESSAIFRVDEEYNDQPTNAVEGIESVLDKVLNRARFQAAHMQNDYVVDINNIRLKPGVRVHLRGGYGSNPNSLQTLFNGIITQVENGEIVTITAQSDAIELSPIVNSTNKKGDSGKIDGGINTGFWLSEPRDLMVRLLSMGTSRFREGFAHATRGRVFSENKFGIRHFGTILYEPLNDIEKAKNEAVVSSVNDAFMSMGEGSGSLWGAGSSFGVLASGTNVGSGTFGLGPEIRVPGVSLMRTLWSNFSAQRDFEIFKRNIYPGNGTGIAQFLGGDLGDGWSAVASLTPDEKTNERINYIGRVSDYSWNRLTATYSQGYTSAGADAKSVIDTNSSANQINNSNGSADVGRAMIGGAIAAAGIAITGGLGAPIIGGALALTGLGGVLSGRGGTHIMNTLGITSGMDDDLPGLDEVSFRAQTYMRSVWDLFQMCARLLPNYIVAIRPFEDRSTVFYGKPHWLYTSGVVPLTTGFPVRSKAKELGVTAPAEIDVDDFLAKTMEQINKESNPLADSAAFSAANASVISINNMISQQLNPNADGSVYLPSYGDSTGNFRGKIIPFGYKSTMEFRGSDGKIVARLPESAGYATIGYHLPIGSNLTEVELNEEQLSNHRQIAELPYRYRFPFFTERKDSVILEDFAYYALADELGTWGSYKSDYQTLALDKWSYNGGGGGKQQTNWITLLKKESQLIGNIKTTDDANLENRNKLKIGIKMEMGNIPNFSVDQSVSGDSYIYSERLNGQGASNVIRMPLPELGVTFAQDRKVAKDYEILGTFQSNSNAASLKEWTAPETALEEQFYIAMQWPYNPLSGDDGLNPEAANGSVESFLSNYGITDPVGNVKDYKNRKVMVYSPTTGKAVVCKPAYFMWGKSKVRVPGQASGGRDEFGNSTNIDEDDNGKSNEMMLEQEVDLSAIVSPDAAYFLGMLNLTPIEAAHWRQGSSSKSSEEWGDPNDAIKTEDAITTLARAGVAPFPVPRKCYYAFVPDSTPLGVVPDFALPADEFQAADGVTLEEMGSGQKIIGFGLFNTKNSGKKEVIKTNGSSKYDPLKGSNEAFFELEFSAKTVSLSDVLDSVGKLEIGGNIYGKAGSSGTDAKSYFDLIKDREFSVLEQDSLRSILKNEKDKKLNISERRFAEVYDPVDPISVEARQYYDEDYDQNVKVIAGNGRTLQQATGIWDQFRFAYHTYTNVKEAFQRAYGLDPDSEEPIPNSFLSQPETSAADFRRYDSANPKNKDEMEAAAASLKQEPFAKYGSTGGTADDEFATIFGDSFFKTPYQFKDENGFVKASITSQFEKNLRTGIEQARSNFIDAGKENDGLIDYFNDLMLSKIQKLRTIIVEGLKQSGIKEEDTGSYIESITTPKQLFLFVVGAFRNAMWKDPYARAWLVLKPNMKLTYDKDDWDFNPVLKIFQAFIDPNEDYAKNAQKFRKLLAANRSEGSSTSNWFGKRLEDVDGFWDKNVGPLFTAIGDSLSGLVNLFRMSMMQLGYGLSQVGQMSKQANILNKVLNDSIYYSLGRPGSLLRAVDNPFTREYGEPVIEIRQPFQRIHYLSSFSHILSNGITENINGVATMVTAVSDGKYPVTVALDKSAPPERQVEKTVETGLYFDNVVGSGLFGALQPILHPFEFARGISKFAQGTPDELLARRVGLAHLRESLKDIYTGEILIIGNADIRPHDIVYLADVYERMYGMFEVEQVVHHFTSELGFVTSITPNALVTVNDPARWFMSSWIGTWLHMQSLRNDTRMYMSSLGSGINNMGQISLDGLSDALQAQMVGGIQYTHGAAAITKDIMAHFASEGISDINSQVKGLVSNQSAFTNGTAKLGGLGAMFAGATALGTAAAGIAALAIPGAGALAVGVAAGLGGGVGARTVWKGWSWIRDNVLDQHGCYIQYINRNGRAMDAGLNQSGQGMVVGRYHTKKLLPGILGVSTKIRTEQGYSYIRTNDLLKSLGWKEKEINDLVRYIDFENALVNSQVIRYSGIGPEKAGLNRFFKIICRVTEVLDGDTVKVVDIFDSSQTPFTVRFDGINTPELNVIKSVVSTNNGNTFRVQSYKIEYVEDQGINQAVFTTVAPHSFSVDDTVTFNTVSQNLPLFDSAAKIEKVTQNTFTIRTSSPVVGTTLIDAVAVGIPVSDSAGKVDWSKVNYVSPGGKALKYVESAIRGKLIILRASPDQKKVTASLAEENFDAGNVYNKLDFYEKDVFGTRTLGVIFYKANQEAVENIAKEVNAIFASSLTSAINDLLNKKLKPTFGEPVFVERFTDIFNSCEDVFNDESVVGNRDYYSLYASSSLLSMSNKFKRYYNAFFGMKVLEYIYGKVSEWPNIEWDEFYDDGTPVTLNYELVVNNLAKIYTKNLLVEQRSVIDSTEMAGLPTQIKVNRDM